MSYSYNADGIRVSKNVNDVRHEYYLDGSRIIKETWADQTLEFLYDENNSVYCIVYTGGDGAGRYYLIKNLQGDVTRILNNNLETVAQYVYDPWGKLVYILDADGEPNSGISIANINPIRYRGYYFDMETGFYYLNARYYDPALGRFINPDEYVSTGQGITGFNMYAYCNNNPINLSDHTGSLPVRNTMAMMTDGGKTPLYMKRMFEFMQYTIDHNINLYYSADSAAEAWANENRELSAERERVAYIYECYGFYYLSDTYSGMKNFAFVQNNVIFPTLRLQFCQEPYGTVYGMIHSHPAPGYRQHNDYPSAENSIRGGDRIAFNTFKYQEMYIVPYERCKNTPPIIKYTDPQTWCEGRPNQ